MIEAGALEEVRALLALGLDDGLPAMRAHGVLADRHPNANRDPSLPLSAPARVYVVASASTSPVSAATASLFGKGADRRRSCCGELIEE